jgi:signal transduction histidine kinase
MFGSLFWLVYEIYKENYELSNSLTEIFYDFNSDPILIYEDETLIKCNKVFLSYFGKLVKYEEFVHHSQMLTEITNPNKVLFEFYQGGNINTISLLEVIRQQKEMDQKELILKKEGGDKIFMFTFYRLENIHNNKTIWTFKDTTHIHQLQKVKSQVEFRSVIMGCLTHELRTPVNCVISILKSMQDYIVDSDEARKLLTIWQGTIEMLRSLTEDFIDFTRFENEKGLPIRMENIEIKKFFTQIKDIFGFQAEEKGLSFSVNYTPEVPEIIYTDPKRLKQVVINLLSNSFKFTQKGNIEINLSVQMSNIPIPAKELEDGFIFDASKTMMHKSMQCYPKKLGPSKLKMRTSLDLENIWERNKRKFLFIEVSDTGIGMEEKDIKELFSKFGTGKNSRGLNTNGLGLGLYLSKEILQNLHGDISCESISGIGSTFKIKLQFDSRYEIKELLNNRQESKSQIFGRKESELEMMYEDFEEFKNYDTRDNLKINIGNYYGMGIRNNKSYIKRRPSFESIPISPKHLDVQRMDERTPSSRSMLASMPSKLELNIVKTCDCK